MQVIPSFDPAATTSGQISVSAPNAGSKILLYNLSLVTIQLNFDNGSTALLHAGEANYLTLDGKVPQIEGTQYNVLNSVQSPSSVVTGVIYGPNERVEGTYPMSLVYSTNIGNPTGVNTNVAGSNQVTNDGNAPGTIFIESTPAGDPASAVTLTNDGILIIGNATHAGHISIDHGKITTDGSGGLAITGTFTLTGGATITGTLTVGGNIQANGGVTFPNNARLSFTDAGG